MKLSRRGLAATIPTVSPRMEFRNALRLDLMFGDDGDDIILDRSSLYSCGLLCWFVVDSIEAKDEVILGSAIAGMVASESRGPTLEMTALLYFSYEEERRYCGKKRKLNEGNIVRYSDLSRSNLQP